MNPHIVVNYAYEDQLYAKKIIELLESKGIQVVHGNVNEEKVLECSFVIHLCSEVSKTSKTHRRIMNFALKHEKDAMIIRLEKGSLASNVELQIDALMALFKYQCQAMTAADSGNEEEQIIQTAPKAEQPVEEAEQPETEQPEIEQPETEQLETEQLETEESETETEETATEEPKAETVQPIVENRPSVVIEKKLIADDLTKEQLYVLGKKSLLGDGCDVNEQQAFYYFRQAANQGHTEAQYQLSICYDRGIGVKRSIPEAAKWCQMAAYGGHSQAQSEIGYCYEYGQGVVRNIKEAIRWYEIASERGNTEATNNLAFCYQKGRGVPRNMKKAIELYEQAAAGGHASAQYNLGFCYWYGEGIDVDKAKAIELFKASAENGNAKAVQMLKILNQRSFIK